MTINVGMIDRALRALVGLVLIALALGYIPGWPATAWGWLGLIPLATAVFGYCPAYTLLGVSTCKRA
jgi:hypothetical protein